MTPRRTRQVVEDDPHDHDRGLGFDLSTLMTRRRALGLAAVGGLVALVGCGSSDDGTTSRAATVAPPAGSTASTTGTTGASAEIPEETAGPYPADGSNGPNVLGESGDRAQRHHHQLRVVAAKAAGVPLTIALTLLDVAEGGTPLAGAAVYLWHCNIDGLYSLYSQGVANENYLRGVQESDASGRVQFTSIFPARLLGPLAAHPLRGLPEPGRRRPPPAPSSPPPSWRCPRTPAARSSPPAATSRASSNLDQTSLATDMVFSDGYSTQLGTVSGSVGSGLTVALNVGV